MKMENSFHLPFITMFGLVLRMKIGIKKIHSYGNQILLLPELWFLSSTCIVILFYSHPIHIAFPVYQTHTLGQTWNSSESRHEDMCIFVASCWLCKIMYVLKCVYVLLWVLIAWRNCKEPGQSSQNLVSMP